ncbi:helix-turn-helix domain-containing protein [Kibdelosporangium persicum]|uniref:Helix-turn-helix transcriptional regulator n=1 Tax=Kibdelosporangium persicum TaxID=2698649 RepID=A0ABX2FDJ6_9PSEU|nr:winged helix-turn-helix transcriptional regulator [Kibdelosporangium persicum]NRN68975.1 Helix-turn-helix transcriptional regulator [Kibdelosporangium persicum]
MADRHYDDPCGIARALDLIGERWALLVVRELLFGPKRFTDLRAGLPTASQNVLSHRLRELERSGILTRRKLGPPASTWAYELTERGYELRPVIIELAKWGSHAPTASTAHLSVAALMVAMLTTYSGGMAGRFELRVSGETFGAVVSGGHIDITPGRVEQPDAVIETDADTLRDIIFGGRPVTDEVVSGDKKSAVRLLRLFPRPAVIA